MNQGTLMPILDSVVVAAEEYTEQASVTDWPARLALVAPDSRSDRARLVGDATGLARQSGATFLHG